MEHRLSSEVVSFDHAGLLVRLGYVLTPLVLGIGMILQQSNMLAATLLSLVLSVVPTALLRLRGNTANVRLAAIICLSLQGAALAILLSAHLWLQNVQVYGYVVLALALGLFDRRAIIAVAISVLLQHLAIDYVLPALFRIGQISLSGMLFHSSLTMLEAAVLLLIQHRLAALLHTGSKYMKRTEVAYATAVIDKAEADFARAVAETQADRLRAERAICQTGVPPQDAQQQFSHVNLSRDLLNRRVAFMNSAMADFQQDSKSKWARLEQALRGLEHQVAVLNAAAAEAEAKLEASPGNQESLASLRLQTASLALRNRDLMLSLQREVAEERYAREYGHKRAANTN